MHTNLGTQSHPLASPFRLTPRPEGESHVAYCGCASVAVVPDQRVDSWHAHATAPYVQVACRSDIISSLQTLDGGRDDDNHGLESRPRNGD